MTPMEAVNQSPDVGVDGSDQQKMATAARPLDLSGGPAGSTLPDGPDGGTDSGASGPTPPSDPARSAPGSAASDPGRSTGDPARSALGDATRSAPGDPARSAASDPGRSTGDPKPMAIPRFTKTLVEARRLAATTDAEPVADDDRPWHLRPLSTEERTATRRLWIPLPGSGGARPSAGADESRSPLWRRVAFLAGVTVAGAAIGGGLSQGIRSLWSAVPSFASDPEPASAVPLGSGQAEPAGSDPETDAVAASSSALAGLEARSALPSRAAGGPLVNLGAGIDAVDDGALLERASAPAASAVVAKAAFTRALAARQAGDLELAAQLYQAAAAVDPDHAAVFYGWGYVLQLQGELDAAVEKYSRAIELDPDHAYAYYNRGYLLQLRGRHIDAIDNYRSASEADGQNPYIFLSWGVSLEKIGEPERARELYRIAIAVAPDSQAAIDAKTRLTALNEPGADDPAVTTASAK